MIDEGSASNANFYGIAMAGGTMGGLSTSKQFESFMHENQEEEDDFYDARGDEKTLQDMEA